MRKGGRGREKKREGELDDEKRINNARRVEQVLWEPADEGVTSLS